MGKSSQRPDGRAGRKADSQSELPGASYVRDAGETSPFPADDQYDVVKFPATDVKALKDRP
eukprot:2410627-Pyramimonas_sp.AAC.1